MHSNTDTIMLRLQNVRALLVMFFLSDHCFLLVINSIADVQNRSIMGPQQEACKYLEQGFAPVTAVIISPLIGFYSTLSQSKERNAIWRIVGYV